MVLNVNFGFVSIFLQLRVLLVIICLTLGGTVFGQTSFNYTIKGQIKGMNNDTLFLSVFSENQKREMIIIPTKNDHFHYKGTASIPSFVWAQTTAGRSTNGNFTFLIEKGDITINGNNKDLTHTIVNGTTGNDEYNYAMSKMNIYYDRRSVLQKKIATITDKSSVEYKNLMNEIVALTDSVALFENEFVAEHPNSFASGMLLMLIADNIPVSQLETYYNNLGDKVKQLAILSKLPTKIEGRKRSVIGATAPDFTMNDVNKKPVTLSDYKGKYVLLDFWASWCVPCRKDNPFLKAAYEKFKDKNFTIISVSVDQDSKSWKQAITKDQLHWTHISDLKSPNKVAELYGVQPIPDNFLIDPQGKIIERGLHGEYLLKRLGDIIK